MELKVLMAHLETSQPNDALLGVTAHLADQFKAHVIGIASCQPMRLDWEDAYITTELLAEDRREIEEQMNAAEKVLHAALDGKAAGVEWRSTVALGSLADYIAHQTRAADLVVTGPEIRGSTFDHSRRVGIANLVMEAGRPVLIVPRGQEQWAPNRILVAWKNTRECRRAVSDALPLLRLAKEVTVSEIVSDAEMSRAKGHVSDVANWLSRHGIKASANAIVSMGPDSDRLREVASKTQPDLVVAGAYGHSRLREWVLGGVTGDYLLNPDRCVLVSH